MRLAVVDVNSVDGSVELSGLRSHPSDQVDFICQDGTPHRHPGSLDWSAFLPGVRSRIVLFHGLESPNTRRVYDTTSGLLYRQDELCAL